MDTQHDKEKKNPEEDKENSGTPEKGTEDKHDDDGVDIRRLLGDPVDREVT